MCAVSIVLTNFELAFCSNMECDPSSRETEHGAMSLCSQCWNGPQNLPCTLTVNRDSGDFLQKIHCKDGVSRSHLIVVEELGSRGWQKIHGRDFSGVAWD